MSEKPQIGLVPWDPESEEHTQRLFDQRVACGWKSDMVESWRGLQREGKMTIQWVVVPEDSPSKSSLLATHTSRCPNESTALTDTAASFGGQPRSPDQTQKFIPVGHISLDTFNPYSAALANPALGIYCISTFYISRALQSAGLGRATMDAVEATAARPPLNARVLALNTLARDQYARTDMWAALEMAVPSLDTQGWYERRGYKAFANHDKAFVEVDKSGKEWWLRDVFMRKEVTWHPPV